MTLPILDDAEHPDGVGMGVSVNLGSYSHNETPHQGMLMVHTVVKLPTIRQEIESNGKVHVMFLVLFQGYIQGGGMWGMLLCGSWCHCVDHKKYALMTFGMSF